MGGFLFTIDLLMLFFFFKTLIAIVKYYSKDYQINTCFIYGVSTLMALFYLFETVQSDVFVWGSYVLNSNDLITDNKEDDLDDFII